MCTIFVMAPRGCVCVCVCVSKHPLASQTLTDSVPLQQLIVTSKHVCTLHHVYELLDVYICQQEAGGSPHYGNRLDFTLRQQMLIDIHHSVGNLQWMAETLILENCSNHILMFLANNFCSPPNFCGVINQTHHCFPDNAFKNTQPRDNRKSVSSESFSDSICMYSFIRMEQLKSNRLWGAVLHSRKCNALCA